MSESEQASRIVRFGSFELDAKAGELRRQGRLVALTGQPLRVLVLLATRAGEIVTREELRRAVWGDETHVDFDAGLSTCINQIRSALGDRAASPRYVETLPRRGYRFIADRPAPPVRPTPAVSRFAGIVCLGAALLAAIALLVAHAMRRPVVAPIPIVVMPVQIDSTRTDLGPVSVSLTDALIGSLASEAGARARVASPLAVKHLRTPEVTLTDLSALGAEYFVHVTLRSLGGPILVHSKLAHISGWILWASDQEVTLDQLERRQVSIALAVAKRVASEILPSAMGRRAPLPDAVGDYAQAVHDLDNGRVDESLSGFAKARARDGEHPGTLAGLAQGTIDAVWLGVMHADAYEVAALDANRALLLDPHNARALAATGALAWLRNADRVEAESRLGRALQLDPSQHWAQVWQLRLHSQSRSGSN